MSSLYHLEAQGAKVWRTDAATAEEANSDCARDSPDAL